MRDSILEVEVDTPTDANLFFRPIGQALRGRVDFLRLAKRLPDAISLTMPFPNGLPGQRVRIDLTAEQCSIVEPLQDSDFAKEKAQLDKRGIAVPEAVELHPGAVVADWLHEIKRGIDVGFVRIVRGRLPDDLGTETAAPEVMDPADKKIDRLCSLIETLIERLVPAGAK